MIMQQLPQILQVKTFLLRLIFGRTIKPLENRISHSSLDFIKIILLNKEFVIPAIEQAATKFAGQVATVIFIDTKFFFFFGKSN